MRVKFCGITNLDDAAEAVRLGAWAIGLIHYDGSPRARRARRRGGDRRRLPAQVRGRRGLRQPDAGGGRQGGRGRGADDGAAERRRGRLSFCAEVARRTGVKVIKAIHVASAADIHAAEAFRTDFHLFDRRGKGLWGGTGESFDWELLRGHRSEVPAILAGGLRPDNVAEAIAVAHPYAVDVASGVEAEPGRKDHAAMAAFFEAAQAASVAARMSAVEERFGPYGGRYVPETLIAALDELTAAWARGARGRRVHRAAATCCGATSSAARRRSTWPSASPSGSARAST